MPQKGRLDFWQQLREQRMRARLSLRQQVLRQRSEQIEEIGNLVAQGLHEQGEQDRPIDRWRSRRETLRQLREQRIRSAIQLRQQLLRQRAEQTDELASLVSQGARQVRTEREARRESARRSSE